MVFQKTFTLARKSKGCATDDVIKTICSKPISRDSETDPRLSQRCFRCHLVTEEVVSHIKEGLQGCEAGIASFFIQHTSAALSINENYDSDVRKDMDMFVWPCYEAVCLLTWRSGPLTG